MPTETAGSTATGLEFGVSGGSTASPYLFPSVLRFAGDLAAGTRVLDVGCGNGFWAGEFARRGCVVVGVDPSPTGIEIARQTHRGARFEVMEVSQTLLTDLGEESFDLIVSTEVVEHLYSPQTWAVGCFNALSPGGTLISSTPYHGWLKDVALAASGRLDRHHDALREGGHIKFFSRATLERLLREAGFEQIQFEGVGRLPAVWKSMVLAATKPR